MQITMNYNPVFKQYRCGFVDNGFIMSGYGSTPKAAYRHVDQRVRTHNRLMNDTGQQHGPEEAPEWDSIVTYQSSATTQNVPAPNCPICNDTGHRFTANFCRCEIGREKLDETISNIPTLADAKEAFYNRTRHLVAVKVW